MGGSIKEPRLARVSERSAYQSQGPVMHAQQAYSAAYAMKGAAKDVAQD